jgi:hypothetical protein
VITVGLSISLSPDLAALGFGPVHLHDAMVEFARYLLARGDRIAYGGDPQTSRFSQILVDLVRTHNRASAAPAERVASYLACHVWAGLSTSDRLRLKDAAQLVEVPAPPDLGAGAAGDPGARATPYFKARCMSAMRERMTQEIDARVVLGGKLAGYKGLHPGVAEEAYLALRSGKPLYLLGAFGGGARAVIEALRGGAPPALTAEGRDALAGHRELADAYRSHGRQEEADRDLIAFFGGAGVRGLQNGLTDAENEALFDADDIHEMIALVLKGLSALPAAGGPLDPIQTAGK